jgi:hypothetical protein
MEEQIKEIQTKFIKDLLEIFLTKTSQSFTLEKLSKKGVKKKIGESLHPPPRRRKIGQPWFY